MATVNREIPGRAIADNLDPLAVSPRKARILLSVGNTRLYQLIGNGELESYLEGRSRRVTMESIRRRVAKLLADAAAPRRCRSRSKK